MASKLLLMTLVVLACLASAHAADASRRRLQQGLTCGVAKALTPDTCKQLCACVAERNPGGPECAGPCDACATAAAACGANDPLPAECTKYSTDPVVLGCIGSRASGRRFAA